MLSHCSRDPQVFSDCSKQLFLDDVGSCAILLSSRPNSCSADEQDNVGTMWGDFLSCGLEKKEKQNSRVGSFADFDITWQRIRFEQRGNFAMSMHTAN